MGKKSKSLLDFKQKKAPKLSQFNSFADAIYKARQKNRQKIHQTKQKAFAKVGVKGRILKAKKANKYALLDQDDNNINLTHKGKPLNQIQAFNDVQFGDQEYFDQKYQRIQQQLHFVNGNDNQPKKKADVYKQIIEKSKMYKQQRQLQYEKNYTSAVELDNNLDKLIPNLKFQNRSSKLEIQLKDKDLQYDRLLHQLQQQERVVPQLNIEKIKKQTVRNKHKKLQQLRQLLQQDQQEDIRGWVQEQVNSHQPQNQSQDQQQSEQEQEDQLDDVRLSQQQEGEQQLGSNSEEELNQQQSQQQSGSQLDFEQGKQDVDQCLDIKDINQHQHQYQVCSSSEQIQ